MSSTVKALKLELDTQVELGLKLYKIFPLATLPENFLP